MLTVAEASSQKGQHSLRSQWQWNQACTAWCCPTGDGNTELHKNGIREMPSDFRLTDYCPKQASATELPLLMQEFWLWTKKKKKRETPTKLAWPQMPNFLKNTFFKATS